MPLVVIHPSSRDIGQTRGSADSLGGACRLRFH